jgi:hypothetical protein
VPTLTNLLGAATALTGGSFVLNTLSSSLLNDNFNAVASSVRSARTQETEEVAWFDLNWEPSGDNTLVYTFQLTPQRRNARPVPQGELVLTLRRYPSLFTDRLLPGESGRQLPDYGTQGRFDTGVTNRIWSDSYVAPGVSPELYAQRAGLGVSLRLLQSAETPIASFEEVCDSLRTHLAESGAGLSPHDRAAVSWAAFVRGRSAQVRAFQDSHCIAQDRQSWADYGFTLPATEPPRPPPPSPAVRDQWLVTQVIPALTHPDANVRYQLGVELFASNVLVNIARDTLFAEGREPEPNSFMPRTVLAGMLEPLRIGCRFTRPEDGATATRFSVLGRRPDNNRLLTLTVDYQTRVGGASSVEINGLTVAPTAEEDFAALEATPNVPARCLNREYAPSAPPAPAPTE